MTDPQQQLSLIEELDARQNDVLDQLEKLNADLEQALKDATGIRAA